MSNAIPEVLFSSPALEVRSVIRGARYLVTREANGEHAAWSTAHGADPRREIRSIPTKHGVRTLCARVGSESFASQARAAELVAARRELAVSLILEAFPGLAAEPYEVAEGRVTVKGAI